MIANKVKAGRKNCEKMGKDSGKNRRMIANGVRQSASEVSVRDFFAKQKTNVVSAKNPGFLSM